jgi:lipopolysaccharide transport system ATP-binding protein
MYVRLAFAVAAHLESEILLIDEVLAVGGAEFQKKCIGKMGEVARGGRTVLFVSHNMRAINRLCRRGILLESGSIEANGGTHSVSARYMVSDSGLMSVRTWSVESCPGDETVRLLEVIASQDGRVDGTVDIRYPVDVHMTYETMKTDANLISSFGF